MGLGGGPNGAKAVFLDKFAGAFTNVKRLEDVRTLVGVSRAQTLTVMDGNVMMNAIPKEVDTFQGYVRVLSYQLNEAIQAAAHVVVVFDEPQAITRGQGRRAAAARRAAPGARAALLRRPRGHASSTTTTTPDDLRADGCNVQALHGVSQGAARASTTRCARGCCASFAQR